MAKVLKIEKAGPLVRMSCYTMQLPRDTAKARAEKRKLSSAARTRMNAKTSWQKCRLALAANFGVGDLFVTLTYADPYLPSERERAVALLKRWIAALRPEYKKAGEALKYLYVTETAHTNGRYHHHIVMNRIDNALELLPSMWTYGMVDIQFIDDAQFIALAQYFTKEATDKGRKLGQRTWTPSKGLKKPDASTQYVPDHFTLSMPPGCYMIENPSNRNEFGEYSYLEYLTPIRQLNKDAEESDLINLLKELS